MNSGMQHKGRILIGYSAYDLASGVGDACIAPVRKFTVLPVQNPMRGRERGISLASDPENEVTRVTSYHPGYHLNRVTTLLMTRPVAGFSFQ